MLTRSGWLVFFGGLATVAAGRVFAVLELFTLGVVAAVLPILALVWVRRPLPVLDAERVVHPRRVHQGGASRVDVEVTNVGVRRSPVVNLVDPVDGTVGARVALAPLRPGEHQQAGYRLPTDHRGVLHIGPMRADLTDPFGLARRPMEVARAATLTVLPAIEALVGMPWAGSRDDPLAGLARRASVGTSADDFATLRPYVVGDDLRRVHWPSSARAGDLLVRQDDARWQGHVTIVVETRAERIDAEPFELAVSAAASLVHAVGRTGDRVRLVLTDGTDSGLVDTKGAADTLLEHLAIAERGDRGALPVLPHDGRQRSGTLVFVGGRPGPEELALLATGRSAFGAVVLVTAGAVEATAPRGVEVVAIDERHPFPPAWAAAVRRMGRRAR